MDSSRTHPHPPLTDVFLTGYASGIQNNEDDDHRLQAESTGFWGNPRLAVSLNTSRPQSAFPLNTRF